jgi:hypothetical protein
MNLSKFVPEKLAGAAGRQILNVKTNSPVILFAAGTVGFVATVVLSVRATMKVDEALNEAEYEQKEIVGAAEEQPEHWTEGEVSEEIHLSRVKVVFTIAKLYAPAVVVGAASIVALTGSHVILTKRNVGLGAALAATDRAFRVYRENVVADAGEEKDQEYRYGLREREIAVDTDEGVAVKTVKDHNQDDIARRGGSMYMKVFDETNRNWENVGMKNQTFLMSVQNHMNNKLRLKGYVLLNDVYDALGMQRTTAGASVGWVKGEGDGKIDFITTGPMNRRDGLDFAQGFERSCWIDFNVQGPIHTRIDDLNELKGRV